MSAEEKKSSVYDYSIHKDRHIVIEASAGTGKTYTITEIISQLIENNIPIRKIAVLTFTEKAAAELQDRIRVRLGQNKKPLSEKAVEELATSEIGTIHQFCRSIIRNFVYQLGLSTRFIEIEDETEDMETYFGIFWKKIEKDDSRELIDLIKKIGLQSFKDFCFEVYSNSQNKKIQSNEKISLEGLNLLVQTIKLSLSNLDLSKDKNPEAKIKIKIQEVQNSTLDSLDFIKLLKEKLFTSDDTINFHVKNKLKNPEIETELNELVTKYKNYQNQNFISNLILYGNLFIQDYSEYKIEKDRVSKNDLIWKSCDLIKSSAVQKIMQEKFTYIIIDECQDSNPSQVQLMTGIFAQKEKGLIFVGDNKQSIYRFLGSDLESYKNGIASLKNPIRLSLDTSYRSTKNLIELHNHIFPDFDSLAESYVPIRTCPERIENDLNQASLILLGVNEDFSQVKLEKDEIKENIFDEIIQTIQRLIQNPNYKILDKDTKTFRTIHYSDIAILGASNASLRFAVEQLSESQLPANLYKADNFYSDPIIQSFVALLFVIENPFDSFSLYKALSSDLFLISDQELLGLSEKKEICFLESSNVSKINTIYKSLKKAHLERYSKPIGTLLLNLIHENFILQVLSTGYYSKRNLTNVFQFIDILNGLQVEESLTFSQVVRKLVFKVESESKNPIKLEADRKNESYESINCMTFHAAKGLEFPVCILFDLLKLKVPPGKNIFPTHESNSDFFKIDFKITDIVTPDYELKKNQEQTQVENEKERLLYVGITRAKDFLVIPFQIAETKNGEAKGLVSFLLKCFTNEKLSEYSEKNLIQFSVKEIETNIQSELKNKKNSTKANEIKLIDLNLNFSSRKGYRIQSFSSLHKKDISKEIVDKAAIIKNEEIPEHENRNPTSQINRVENEGASFGLLCHKIFEIFPLEKLSLPYEEIRSLVNEFVKKYYQEFGLKNNPNYTSEEAVEYIFSTLIKEYPMDEKNEKFTKIKDWNYFSRERSFYYALNSKSIDLLIGIGDGLFEYDGKYYIIDWKSNLFTDNEQLNQIVETSYREQYMIYSLNLLKNISPENSERIWNEKFGGMLFIFIREIENRKGIVFIKPKFQELIDFKNGLE